jgi:hypothetical protein
MRGAGGVLTPGPRLARVESWAPHGAQTKSWAPHRARWKSAKLATKSYERPCGLTAWGGSRIASLYSKGGLTTWVHGLTTILCSRHDLTTPDVRSDNQLRLEVESPWEHEAPVVLQAWEPHRESHPVEEYLNH